MIKGTVDQYQNNKAYKEFKNMDDEEFKVIVKEAYEAKEIAPFELNDIFEQDAYRMDEEIKLDRKNKNYTRKYGTVEAVLMEQIKKRYSEVDYVLTRLQVFIKAKILSIREEDEGDGFLRILVRLKPEQIIKGKAPVINEPEFEVYFRRYEMVLPEKDFKVGKSYLFPLFDRNEPNNPELAIATWVDGFGSRFLVENNVLNDEYNFFKMGTNISWDDFVKNINNKIFGITNLLED